MSEDYDLNVSMIGRWRREYISKSGDFTKKERFFLQEQELKSLKKELRNVTMEREGLLYSRFYIALLIKELGLKSVLKENL